MYKVMIQGKEVPIETEAELMDHLRTMEKGGIPLAVSESKADEHPELAGQPVFVAGATGGIGTPIVHALAAQGMDLAIADTSFKSDDLQDLAAKIRDGFPGVRVLPIEFDMTKPEDVKRAVHSAAEEFDGLGYVVNSAAVIKASGKTDETDWETYDLTMGVNVRGNQALAMYAIPFMLKRGLGRYVIINSKSAVNASPGNDAYSTSKAANKMQVGNYARTYDNSGIAFYSPMFGNFLYSPAWTNSLFPEKAEQKGMDLFQVFEHYRDQDPTGMFFEYKDATGEVIRLFADRSLVQNGKTWMVDLKPRKMG